MGTRTKIGRVRQYKPAPAAAVKYGFIQKTSIETLLIYWVLLTLVFDCTLFIWLGCIMPGYTIPVVITGVVAWMLHVIFGSLMIIDFKVRK